MNISGMRPYEGFYEYNSIKAVALRSQQIAAVQNASGDEELSVAVSRRDRHRRSVRRRTVHLIMQRSTSRMKRMN